MLQKWLEVHCFKECNYEKLLSMQWASLLFFPIGMNILKIFFLITMFGKEKFWPLILDICEAVREIFRTYRHKYCYFYIVKYCQYPCFYYSRNFVCLCCHFILNVRHTGCFKRNVFFKNLIMHTVRIFWKYQYYFCAICSLGATLKNERKRLKSIKVENFTTYLLYYM